MIARDSSGNLYLYPSDASRGLSRTTCSTVGTGWGSMTFAGLSDWSGDGKPDIVARDSAGTMWAYIGTGTAAGTSGRMQIGADW